MMIQCAKLYDTEAYGSVSNLPFKVSILSEATTLTFDFNK
jgi:hypothetical protein